MKRIVAAMIAAAGMLAVAGTATAAPLKIGISAEPYPPFTYKSAEGDWTGFEVELAEAICAEMNAECKITPTGWGGIIPALNSGKIDVIMNSMSITAERDEVIDFTDPYYYTRGAFVASSDMQLGELPGDLEGKILGVQGATTHANFAREELSDTVAQIQQYDKQEQANRDLLAGRVDVILADEIAMTDFVEREDIEGYAIKLKAPKHPAFGDGIGIGVREGDDELTGRLNEAIATVLQNGTCTELSKKYFGTDICGG